MLSRLEEFFEKAREGMIAALKYSGERFADLRELGLEDLYHDYAIYRKQVDAELDARRLADLRNRRSN